MRYGRGIDKLFDLGNVHHLNIPGRSPMSGSVPVVDPALFEVIRLLESRPQISQREVASSLGVSLGKANYCLRALISRGLVKAENYRKSSNKRAYLYLLTPAGVTRKAELARQFLALRMKEYEALRLEIDRLKQDNDPVSPTASHQTRGTHD